MYPIKTSFAMVAKTNQSQTVLQCHSMRKWNCNFVIQHNNSLLCQYKGEDWTMFCRGISGFARIGARSLTRIIQRNTRLQSATVLNTHARHFSSETPTNSEISSVRLWSDGGGGDVVSNPFDDLGAWHDAEPKSFLHSVSVDTVGKSTAKGQREANEDSYKLLELQPDLYYFAVFDGHGGSIAVDFVSEHLHDCIKHFYRSDKSIENVLVDAFSKCNSDLEEYCEWLIERGKF